MATGLTGQDLVVPVVARTPGLLGSQWRTDLVVTNTGRDPFPVPVQVTFMNNDGPDQALYLSLGPLGSLAVEDVVRDAFGHEQAFGLVRVTSGDPEVRLTARARIVNVGGPEGEYGQGVPGLPTALLPLRATVAGVSGTGGNRTNLGIANPHATEAQVFIELWDAGGSLRGGVSVGVAAYSVLQLNDIFSHFGVQPLPSANVQVTSSVGVYVYGSVVRADTGDAVFVVGAGEAPDNPFEIVEPECDEPAPMALALIPSGGWIVSLRSAYDAADVAAELSGQYGFTVTSVLSWGFIAELDPLTVAGLRCEEAVERLDQSNAQAP
jgi:hypothetical protein